MSTGPTDSGKTITNKSITGSFLKWSSIIGLLAIVLNVFIQTNEVMSAFDGNKDRIIILWKTAKLYFSPEYKKSLSNTNFDDLIGIWTHEKTGRTLTIIAQNSFRDSSIADEGRQIDLRSNNEFWFWWVKGGFCGYRIKFLDPLDTNKINLDISNPINAPSCISGTMIRQNAIQTNTSLLAFVAILLAAGCAVIISARELLRSFKREE